jgi:hypothetical protein
MKTLSASLKVLTCAIFVITLSSIAQAQAIRTWVSGLGDDANPCSRTAPCKTFAGAISKTAINGEIDALDPGGFGAVTITKSITLDGTQGAGFASILASGSNGVVINLGSANANDPLRIVRFRNLSITGTGTSGSVGTRTGVNGIFISGSNTSPLNLVVENCLITDFSQRGISVTSAAASGTLHITDSIIRNNGQAGVAVLGSGVTGAIDNTRFELNGGTTFAGLAVDGSGHKIAVSNSVASSNGIGFFLNSTSSLSLESSSAVSNNVGLQSTSSGGANKMRLSNVNVTNNTTGVSFASNAVVTSYGNNHINGNTAGDALPAGSVVGPQ